MAEQKQALASTREVSVELAKRSVAVILAQSRAGAGTALLMGGALGAIYVPAVGWGPFLAWYCVLAACMVARQFWFHRLVERDGATETTLRRIAIVAALTGWLLTVSIPLFSSAVSLADLGVLTIIAVGWISVAVAVLAVAPRVYAVYLAACLFMVFLGWVPRASARELVLIGIAMCLGGPMMVRLARVVQSQLRDAVEAAQQNAVLVVQLRQALQRQEETQRARSRFLGAASHDLRQPVQALLFLSDIFRRTTEPGRRDAMAQQIMRTGESIDSMFRHLVDFAQIDAGTMKAVVQPVQLDQLIAAAVSGFAEKCGARGLRFRLDQPGPCTVAADPVLLERMLRNFLDNAYKYSLAGEIVLRVARQGEEVQVCVADEGVGMEAEDLAQACNAFYRGRSAALAEAEGIGLGLAISSHMADLMDADLELQSRPGRGTSVCVRLRLAQQVVLVPAHPPVDRGDSLLKGRLVAVVENDRLARDALCSWLLEGGARVAQGGSIAQLLDALRHADTAPDLMLADFRLTEATGVEAVQAVRAEFGHVPAWIISGEADIAERGLDLPVLQKPITPERLLEAVRSALEAEAR
ncbi:MAG TPA: hybrid sensor histidine kinase/response regulator [Ramlibacter sp.]|nr:hybrid sensor histidine kinase/response regulator [Ramlibacter sp.]